MGALKMLHVKSQDVKQTDEISGHILTDMISMKSRHSYCSYRIIQTTSEQSLQRLVRTESYERFYILPKKVKLGYIIVRSKALA